MHLLRWIAPVFMLLSFPCFPQTWVPGGNVGGQHWTKPASPYYIMGDITVQKDSLLFIDPGVRVIFTGYYYLRITLGCLRAEGTETDSIVFTVQDTTGYYDHSFTGWNGIQFTGNCSPFGSLLYHVVIEFGRANGLASQRAQGGGLDVTDCSNLHIIRSSIRNNLAISSSLTATSALADGGGIWLSQSPVLIEECEISNNEIYVSSSSTGFCRGAGLYIYESQPIIRNNYFHDNLASGNSVSSDWCLGGAIYVFDCLNLVISNNVFKHNFCPEKFGSGGAIYLYYGDATIVNNNFTENLVSMDGGGILGSALTTLNVVNNLFYHNMSSGGDGAGLKDQSSTRVRLTNNSFINNTANNYGGGIHGNYGTDFIILNSIFFGNTPSQIGFSHNGNNDTIRYCTIEGGITGIHVYDDFPPVYAYQGVYEFSDSNNPQFADPAAWDYSLTAASPCINAGQPDTTGLDLPDLDLSGFPRIEKDTVDRGAYEYSFNLPPTDITLSHDTVPENQPSGYLIGSLHSLDPDSNDIFEYEIVTVGGDSLDNQFFQLSNDLLLTTASFNYEQDSVLMVGICSRDSHGHPLVKAMIVRVTDYNDPPYVIASLSDVVVPGLEPSVIQINTAVFLEEDAGDSLRFEITLEGFPELPSCLSVSDSLVRIRITGCNPTLTPLRWMVTAFDKANTFAAADFLMSILDASGSFSPQLLLYPNPATETMYVSFPYSPDKPVEISIFCTTGQLLKHLTLDHSSLSTVLLDVSGLSAGIYLLKISSEDFNAQGKILKINE